MAYNIIIIVIVPLFVRYVDAIIYPIRYYNKDSVASTTLLTLIITPGGESHVLT